MTEIDLVYQTRLENPEKLIHNVKNAATHSSAQIDRLAHAFKKFGFIGSVVVGRDNVILAGHGRVLAALKAGMPDIPVTDVSHLDDDEQAAYMIAENKLAELKGWDQELLDSEITRLTGLNFELGDLGFIDEVVSEFNGPGPREHSEEPGKHSPDEQWETDDDEDGESREERYEAAEREDDIDEKPEPVDAPIPFEVPARVTAGSAWRLGSHVLVCGNSSDASTVHKFIPEESAHSIVSDPPYGISFMGKEWDHGVPSAELWKVWFSRVTPGAHILSFCATRMYHHMAINIENAGFEPRDMISWMYGSGMPKSMNISKAIDKAAGYENNRPVSGKNPSFNPEKNISPSGWVTAARPEFKTTGYSESAKQWDGFGTGLKPSQECIMLARKPHTEPTIAKNVQRYGTGGLNIDGCRVKTNGESLKGGSSNGSQQASDGWDRPWKHDPIAVAAKSEARKIAEKHSETNGRWPSNVILSHADGCVEVGVKTVGKGEAEYKDRKRSGFPISGSVENKQKANSPDTYGTETVEDWQCVEDCPVRILDEQSGVLKSGANPTRRKSDKIRNAYGDFKGEEECIPARGADSGGASRFFYVPKPSRADKSEGNNHATVKPVRLMQYLIKLVTPPGGTVLEPFAGSGTTLLAAEKLHMKCIAFELDPHHCDIIIHRWQTMTGREAEPYISHD